MSDKDRIIIQNKINGSYHDTGIPTLLSFFVSNGKLYARIKTVDIYKNEMKLDMLAERLIEWVDKRLKPALEKLEESKDLLRKSMFMEDGKTPRCYYCKGPMHNYTPTKGKFKGQLQTHCWVCDCSDFQGAGIILSVG